MARGLFGAIKKHLCDNKNCYERFPAPCLARPQRSYYYYSLVAKKGMLLRQLRLGLK